MSEMKAPPSLYKHRSLPTPDSYRDESVDVGNESSGEHNPQRGVVDSNRLMSEMKAPPPLYKHRSLPTPDSYRDEAWLKRKGDNANRRIRRSKSVTDEDLDELKACIELGFTFDSPELMDDKLTDTLPALGLYYAVHKNYNLILTKSASTSSSTSSMVSELDPSSPFGSPHHTLLTPGDSPQIVKTRLRQWAQVVACSVRQIC